MKVPLWLSGPLLIVILLTGCGSTSAIATNPTATAIPTLSPFPTVDPVKVAQICGSDFPQTPPYSQFGDLVMSHPRLGGLTYPDVKLPDNMPAGTPYQIDGPQSTYGDVENTPGVLVANPYFGDFAATSYGFSVCNISTSQAYQLQSATAQIASLEPDTSANLNIHVSCDRAFSSQKRLGEGGGCGGSEGGDWNRFKAMWPATVTSGTYAIQVPQQDSFGGPAGQILPYLPLSLAPGKTYDMYITMDYPAPTGTYAFQFGVKTDKGVALSPLTKPVFLAKNVAIWSGYSCFKSYQAAIPNSGEEKFYVCPGTGF